MKLLSLSTLLITSRGAWWIECHSTRRGKPTQKSQISGGPISRLTPSSSLSTNGLCFYFESKSRLLSDYFGKIATARYSLFFRYAKWNMILVTKQKYYNLTRNIENKVDNF